MKQQMTFEDFRASLQKDVPANDLDPLLKALWYDGKGDWSRAHDIAQEEDTPAHCRLHAYLHRKEGDNWNANYWYTRANQKMPQIKLDDEWERLVREWL